MYHRRGLEFVSEVLTKHTVHHLPRATTSPEPAGVLADSIAQLERAKLTGKPALTMRRGARSTI
jgi:hypothetical protein